MKRALTLVAVIAIVCIVLLLLMLRKLEDYRSPPAPTPTTAPPDAGDGGESYSGRVFFADGVPAEGAVVTISWGAAGEARSAEQATEPGGRYTLPAEVPGSSREHEIHARFGPLQTAGRDTDDRDIPVPTLEFPATFRLAGRVQSRTDRAAVGRARVVCAGVETRSDDRGAFALDGVPAATLRDAELSITVESDGHERLVWELPRDELPPYYGDLTLLLVPSP